MANPGLEMTNRASIPSSSSMVTAAAPKASLPTAEPKAVHFAPKFAASRPSADSARPAAQAWAEAARLAPDLAGDVAQRRLAALQKALASGDAVGVPRRDEVGRIGRAEDVLEGE